MVGFVAVCDVIIIPTVSFRVYCLLVRGGRGGKCYCSPRLGIDTMYGIAWMMIYTVGVFSNEST